MNTKSMLVGAVVGWVSMIAGLQVAKADCDLDVEALYSVQEHVVTDYSYSRAFARGRQGRYTECADEAELTACATVEGMACAADMQRVYSACVGQTVCDAWVQGALEDGTLVGSGDDISSGDEALGSAYSSCVNMVMRAGGPV